MKSTTKLLSHLLCILLGLAVAQSFNHPATAADPYRVFEPQLNSPAVSLVAITSGNGYLSDSADLPIPSRGIFVGGAGDVVAIGMNDGVTQNGASTANAATLSFNMGGNLPAYSSSAPGQYIVCGDGAHAAEIISGYIAAGTTTLTVTTGGGSGANTTANAHNTGTLIAAYAPLKSCNAGTPLPVRARRVMSTNTTATNLTELY